MKWQNIAELVDPFVNNQYQFSFENDAKINFIELASGEFLNFFIFAFKTPWII